MKKFANGLMVFCALCCVMLLQACSGSSPRDVVEDFNTYFIGGDAEKAYELLSQEDKENLSLEAFKKKVQEASQDPLLKEYFALLKEKELVVLDEQIGETSATVKTKQYVADFASLFKYIVQIAFENSNASQEEQLAMLKEKAGGSLPLKETEISYSLLKENNEWKLRISSIIRILLGGKF